MIEDHEFWPLKQVMQRVGLSKSEIYRRMAEGRFPVARPYGQGSTKRFWLASEIRAWQADILGDNHPMD